MDMTRTEVTAGRLLRLGGLFLALLFMWVMLGPRQFGGSVSYVITQGNSMQPVFESGDLVIVRKASDYRVGDVIAAENEQLQAPVLHRIIEEGAQRYVTKGDNNDFIDEYEPSADDIIGKKWILLPGGGAFLRKMLTPFGTSLLIGLLGFAVLRGRKGEPNIPETPNLQEPDRVPRRWETPTEQLRWMAIPIGLALAYFLALGFFSFTRPVSENVTRDATYEHAGRFTYAAGAEKSPLYPSGRLRTGDVIHTERAQLVRFSFKDTISSDDPIAMAGDALLSARLHSDIGWSRTFPLDETSWMDQASLSGELDVRKLNRLATRVAEDTGFSTPFLLEIRASVEPNGFVAGEPIEEPFTATLRFQLVTDVMQPVLQNDDGSDALRPEMEGEIPVQRPVAKTVDLLGVKLPVDNARRMALGGGTIALLLAGALGFIYRRAIERETESERILARYGEWLVPVTTLESLEGLPSVPTSDIEGLVRMADRQGRMALYVVDRPEIFFFEQSGIVYFYETKEATQRVASPADPVTAIAPQEPSPTEEIAAGASVEARQPDRRKATRPKKFKVNSLEEAEKAAAAYKTGAIVIVDLSSATPAATKSSLDFISGLVYATGGQIQRKDRRILTLFPPSQVHHLAELAASPKKAASARKSSSVSEKG